jgi:hypothetical protein
MAKSYYDSGAGAMIEKISEREVELREDAEELSWLVSTLVDAEDFHRVRTLSLADDPEQGAADLVEQWKVLDLELEKLRQGLARVMTKYSDDGAYITKCEQAWAEKCLKILKAKTKLLEAWEPPFSARLRII